MAKLYCVTLQTCVIGVLGNSLKDVLLTVAELYPDELILSAVLAPEWDDKS